MLKVQSLHLAVCAVVWENGAVIVVVTYVFGSHVEPKNLNVNQTTNVLQGIIVILVENVYILVEQRKLKHVLRKEEQNVLQEMHATGIGKAQAIQQTVVLAEHAKLVEE